MLKRFTQNLYIRKIVSLFASGLIPVVFTPLLSRFYKPIYHNDLQLLLLVSGILSTIGMFRLDLAVLIPKDIKESIYVIQAALRQLFITCFLFAVIAPIVSPFDVTFSVLAAIVACTSGSILLLTQFVNRLNYNKTLAKHKVVSGLSVSPTQLLLSSIPNGLLIGKAIGDIISITPFIKVIREQLLEPVKSFRFKDIVKKYKQFPLITLPHGLFNLYSNNIPFLVFNYLGMFALSGEFALIYRIALAPINLIAVSFNLAFSERFAAKSHAGESVLVFFKKNLVFLFVALGIPLSIVTLTAPYYLTFLLGDEWVYSGKILAILTPVLVGTLLTSPFTYVLQFKFKQFQGLLFELLNVTLKTSGVFIGLQFGPLYGLVGFSIGTMIMQTFYGFYVYYILKQDSDRLTPNES